MTFDGIEKAIAAEDLQLTITLTRPDLDVIGFQASVSKWPHLRHAVGRSHGVERAIMFAIRLWGNGQYGVWTENDESTGGSKACVSIRKPK